jgi:oligopeptide transport system permease protein
MAKYVLKRLIHGLISSFIVVAIVMIMIYSMLDKNLIFKADTVYTNYGNNEKVAYSFRKWEEYGYLDYLTYNEYLLKLVADGELDEDARASVASFGKKPENDSDKVAEYVKKFNDYCAANGYTVVRLNAIMMNGKKYASDQTGRESANMAGSAWNTVWKKSGRTGNGGSASYSRKCGKVAKCVGQ